METDASIRSLAESVAIFAAAGPKARKLLVDGAERVELAAGEFLFRQGDPSDALFVVTEGELEVCLNPAPSWASPILLGPGDPVGELQVFVGGRRGADVRATRPTSLLREPREVVRLALAAQPDVFDELLELIQKRLRQNELQAALPRLFGPLEEEARAEIQRLLEWQSLARGETLFDYGDEPDGMYFVVSGRLQVFLPLEDGSERILGDVARGEFVGEMAVLTSEPRSASVRVLRDCKLVRLPREGVRVLAEKHPVLLLNVAQTLIKRHRRQEIRSGRPAEVRTIAIVGASEEVPVEDLARRLAQELDQLAPSLLVDHESAQETLGLEGVIDISPGHSHDCHVTTWMAELESRYSHVVLLAGNRPTAWARRCVEHADKVLLVAAAGGDPSPGPTETALVGAGVAQKARVPTALVLLHEEDTTLPTGTARWLEPRTLERHFHVRPERSADLSRLARLVTGKALGVVLGGGGARAGAHMGVLRALRAEGLTIDAVGGTSAGAGLAALYAMGLDDDEIRARCVQGFVEGKPFRAVTLPLMSIVSRQRLDDQARKMYGEVQIEDLWIDYFCVACNLTRGKTELMRTGPLWKAVRASTSLPGVAVPVIQDGDLLVDGGVLDNLPGRLMRGLVGGQVVVVDISADDRESEIRDYEDLPSPWQLLRSRLSPFRKTIHAPSIAGVILRAVTVSSLEERARALADADLVLRPPVSQYGIFDFAAIEQMADDAEVYTRQTLRESGILNPATRRGEGAADGAEGTA